MKKFLVVLLALAMLLSFAACANQDDPTDAPTTDVPTTGEVTPEPTGNEEFDPSAKSEGTMTYAEYAAAEIDDEVVIEAFVQAHQSWWMDSTTQQGKITVYAQDPDGAYFIYEMVCSEEDAALLIPGTKIRVTGYKSEWSGEVEITEASFEILESQLWIAEARDVTALLGTEDLINYQNQFVSFKNATVVASTVTGNETEYAVLYKWNNTGNRGDDLYFNVQINGATYTFTVESYLCDENTEVYQAVEALKIGDVIDLEGFLYWYDGVNPHITSVTHVTGE